jgi:hypothetical protein
MLSLWIYWSFLSFANCYILILSSIVYVTGCSSVSFSVIGFMTMKLTFELRTNDELDAAINDIGMSV